MHGPLNVKIMPAVHARYGVLVIMRINMWKYNTVMLLTGFVFWGTEREVDQKCQVGWTATVFVKVWRKCSKIEGSWREEEETWVTTVEKVSGSRNWSSNQVIWSLSVVDWSLILSRIIALKSMHAYEWFPAAFHLRDTSTLFELVSSRLA